MDASDISITMEEGVLTISGKKRAEAEERDRVRARACAGVANGHPKAICRCSTARTSRPPPLLYIPIQPTCMCRHTRVHEPYPPKPTPSPCLPPSLACTPGAGGPRAAPRARLLLLQPLLHDAGERAGGGQWGATPGATQHARSTARTHAHTCLHTSPTDDARACLLCNLKCNIVCRERQRITSALPEEGSWTHHQPLATAAEFSMHVAPNTSRTACLPPLPPLSHPSGQDPCVPAQRRAADHGTQGAPIPPLSSTPVRACCCTRTHARASCPSPPASSCGDQAVEA
mgnify:CR=1 FL=1